jgi:hypothetical protein
MARGFYLQEPDDMVKLATELVLELKKHHKGETFSVRLLGVRCSNFQREDERADDANQMNMDQFLCSPRKEGTKRAASTTILGHASTTDKSSQRQLPAPMKSAQHATIVQTTAHYTAQQEASENPACPMCGQVIREQDNDAVNRHIDTCLNSSAVRQAIQEESLAATRDRVKKRRLTDFFFQRTP